ncbi:PQ-loop domain-containing transporter [Mycoplasma seminis]|uniref:PQ-loop domain-containing transporter n=1 Tax=Mycoplasma seminis TaxID=512749 RepID=A0ABY9HA50_9MOLU|nr:PQ-loop domain-containing transporter [Mycoplasma seminis]WLP85376.1 PQ-loop domain-containing transporter [Mycoplasma seminis]
MLIFSFILGFCACLPVLFGSFKLLRTKKVDGFSVISIMVSETGSLCYSIMGWNDSTYIAILVSGAAVYAANLMLMSIYFAYSQNVVKLGKLRLNHWWQFGINFAAWSIIFVVVALAFHFHPVDSKIFQAIFSFLAPVLIAIAVMPQIIETFKTRDVKNLSLPMFSISQCLCTCWIIWWSITTHQDPTPANIIGVAAQVFFFLININQIILIIYERYLKPYRAKKKQLN